MRNKFIQKFLITLGIVSSVLCLSQAVHATNIHIYSNGGGFRGDVKPCTTNINPNPKMLMFMGGGLDVAPAYQKMIQNMCARDLNNALVPGNFVVIRADNDSKYDKYIYDLAAGISYSGTQQPKLGSVTTIVIQQQITSLSNQELDQINYYLKSASAVFMTGGDQYFYALQYSSNNGGIVNQLADLITNYNVPVGGTSAGMMMLSPVNYIGHPNYGTLSSYTAVSAYAILTPPLSSAILPNAGTNIPNKFWNLNDKAYPSAVPFCSVVKTSGCSIYSGNSVFSYFPSLLDSKNKKAVIVDAHFAQRDRMARLMSFMYAFGTNSNSYLKTLFSLPTTSSENMIGIGVNSQTALLITTTSPINNQNTLEILTNSATSGAIYVVDGSANTYNTSVYPNLNISSSNKFNVFKSVPSFINLGNGYSSGLLLIDGTSNTSNGLVSSIAKSGKFVGSSVSTCPSSYWSSGVITCYSGTNSQYSY